MHDPAQADLGRGILGSSYQTSTIRSLDFDSVSISAGEEGKALRICGVAGERRSERVAFWFAIDPSLVVRRNLVAFQIHDLDSLSLVCL